MFDNSGVDTTAQIYMMLEREAKILKSIADREWRKYLSSYTPKVYIRTNKATESAIKVGAVKPIMGGEFLSIEVTWDNDLSYHDSIFSGGAKGHAFMLISDGWNAKKLEARRGRIDRHTYWGGSGYLYNVYKAYNARKNPLVILDVQWSGKYTK